MWQARKAQDLLRDPRFALHSAPVDPGDDPATWPGEAKLGGDAEQVTDLDRFWAVIADGSPDSMHLFRLDLREVGLHGPVPGGRQAGDRAVATGRGRAELRPLIP